MRMKWLLALAFLSLAAFVAGCGGDSDRGYQEYDSYEAEVGGGGTPPPPSPGGSAVGSHDPVGDATGGGLYGKRVHVGGGRPGEVGESEWKQTESIGKDVTEAHKLFQEYMDKKAKDGTQDTATKQRALSLLDQAISQIDSMLEKYPESYTLQEYRKTATEDRHALAWE